MAPSEKPAPRPTIPPRSGARSPEPVPDANLCVLRGVLSSKPELRDLPSGARLAVLQVRTRRRSEPATSVPVAWWDPSAGVEALDRGDAVLVVGAVRRRFFRDGEGRAGSRVEVVADRVLAPGDRRRLGPARRRALAAIEAAFAEPGAA